MYVVVMILVTILNIFVLFINGQMIIDFKKTQIRFINQQNRNVVDIFDIKTKLGMFNE